jgi:hypothetical protein
MGDQPCPFVQTVNLRAAYVELKERAAAEFPEGRVRYNELKGPFLAKVKAALNRRLDTVPPQIKQRWLDRDVVVLAAQLERPVCEARNADGGAAVTPPTEALYLRA